MNLPGPLWTCYAVRQETSVSKVFLLLHPYPPTRGYGVKGMILLAKVRKKY